MKLKNMTKKQLIDKIKSIQDYQNREGLMITYNSEGLVMPKFENDDKWKAFTLAVKLKVDETNTDVADIRLFKQDLDELINRTVVQAETFPQFLKRKILWWVK